MEIIKKNILKRCQTLFLRYGIKSVTMDDIARELGISKKTLYQHFDTKNKIIEQMVVEHFEAEQIIMATILNSATDAVDEILSIAQHIALELARLTSTFIYDLQKYHRETWLRLEQTSNQHNYGIIKKNIERGIQEGLYRTDLDADIIAKLYVAKSLSILDDHLFPTNRYSKTVLYKQFIVYHLHGILAPKGLELLKRMIDKS
jgi:TetR/AcrR family transcriptional regulator, cholesterol catabolism regulator